MSQCRAEQLNAIGSTKKAAKEAAARLTFRYLKKRTSLNKVWCINISSTSFRFLDPVLLELRAVNIACSLYFICADEFKFE